MTAIAAWLLLCPFAGLLIRLSVKSEWVAAQLALVGAPLLLLCRLRTSGLAPRKPASVNVNFACFIFIPHISPARTRPWEASLPTLVHTHTHRKELFLPHATVTLWRPCANYSCSSDTSDFCTFPICCLSDFSVFCFHILSDHSHHLSSWSYLLYIMFLWLNDR